jgi:CRISPR-associated endonuclease Csn1
MKKTLGLNIGTASIGFSVIDEKSSKIDAIGVHLFELSENAAGASLASIRRQKINGRILLKRRASRMENILKYLKEASFECAEDVKKHHSESPWVLRKEGLERLLTDIEFSRVIYHLAKHRGFQSNRKSHIKTTEDQVINAAIQKIEDNFERSGLETIGAYLCGLERQRNSSYTYSYTVTRQMVLDEVNILFEQQRAFGNDKATEKLQEQVWQEIKFQRPLQSVAKLVGSCTYFPEEKRAPKCSLSAEMFLFYSKLNNLKILKENGTLVPITSNMRQMLWEEALKYKEIKYSKIRKLWKLDDDVFFNLVFYNNKKEVHDSLEKIKSYTEQKEVFCKFHGYYTLKNIFEENIWETLKEQRSVIDHIVRIVSFEFDEKTIIQKLWKIPLLKTLNEETIKKIAQIDSLGQTINLSFKAVSLLLPLLIKGKRYDEAVKEAEKKGLFPVEEPGNQNKLAPFGKTNNAIVDRALAQTRKVMNACIRRFGMPNVVQIEIARDLGKSKKERIFILKEQQKNRAKNENAKRQIKEEFKIDSPAHDDILRYKLWCEQDKRCAYSGEYIAPHDLFTSIVQVDYILPYSRSWDNSYMNKVLCFARQNQEKANFTPFEKWGQDKEKWSQLEKMAMNFPLAKRHNFLLEVFDEEEWKNRSLNDTRYITKYFQKQLEKQLPSIKIICVKSAITNTLRHRWGFGEKDRETDTRHYGVDAVVVACAKRKFIEKITEFYKEARKDNLSESNGHKYRTPQPWNGFRNDVLQMKENLFVSRMPRRSLNGEGHAETIKSYRKETEKVVKRIKLSTLKNADIFEALVDKELNHNFYKLLKERVDEYAGDIKKAFSVPLFRPNQKHPITSIRVYDNSKTYNFIRNGCADNAEIVRVDVFSKKNHRDVLQYYLCPLYVKDLLSQTLPDKVCVPYKNEDEWLIINDAYKFEFSLYKNDLFEIEEKNGNKLLLYYRSMNRVLATIIGVEHFHAMQNLTIKGVKTLKSFKKYSVNYFGERFEVTAEKRLDFSLRKN